MNKRLYLAFNSRASVLSHVAAATVGAYVVASLLTSFLALIFPAPATDAVTTASMVGLLAWAIIVMAVFHARSATRAWSWIIGTALLLGLFVWLLSPGALT